ncbi:TonB-dependent siderophore receptor [Pseudorhodoferax sp.]|uniref:TonB-dependent siderophore receptor n=1 Tax=Pseudorhodoferax sp. TaxID=1993553 RepID=UPI0039E27814
MNEHARERRAIARAMGTAMGVLAAGTLGLGAARAQDPPTPPLPPEQPAAAQALPTVQVRESSLDATTEHSGSYTTGGVSIGKATRSLRETPQSVTVITRYRLDDQNMRTVDDALLNAPGVIAEYQSSTERSFYARGFPIDQVQFDGVPTVRGSGFTTSYDLSAFDRVEILRGPAGLFDGAGQPGGTINLVRKRPTRDPQFQAKAEAGRWNFKRVEADLSRPLNASGTLRGRIVAAYENREFFYDYAEADKQVLYAIVEADLGPRTTVGLGLNYERNDSVPFYTGLPRYSNGADLRLPRSRYTNGGWSTSDIRNTTLFADLKHQFNADWRMKLAVSTLREDNTEATGAGSGAINPATGVGFQLSAFDQRLDSEQHVLDGHLIGSFEALGRRHELVVGGNYQKLERNIASQAYASFPVDIFHYDPRDYTAMPTTPSRAATNTTLDRTQKGVYGYLRWSLPAATRLTFGGRLSYFERDLRNNVTGTYSTPPYKETRVFTPYAALEHDLAPDWTGYLSYARSFVSQAERFTASGDRLEPARGYNVELGLKGALLQGRLNGSVALFHSIEQNRAQVDANNPDPCPGNPAGTGACYVAEGKVRSQGLDAEVTGALTPRWQMAAGYTFNTTRYLHDRTASGAPSANEGRPLSTFTPRHLLRLWSAYRLPGTLQAWTVGGGVNFQTKMYKTNSSGSIRVEQGTYAVWNARVAWQATRNVTLALNASNLFDRTYYRTIDVARLNWYGEPRNVTLSMQAVF